MITESVREKLICFEKLNFKLRGFNMSGYKPIAGKGFRKSVTWKESLARAGYAPLISRCPTGEQITNGGFETGDTTDWTVTGTIEVVTYKAHSGSYSARTLRNKTGTVAQTLSTSVPTVCIVDTSTFGLYILSDWSWSPEGGGIFTAKINYTDGTSTTVTREITEAEENAWQYWDLKPYLEADKEIESIKITLEGNVGTLPYVDDISLIP